jgi:hypothetical protein
MIFMIGLKLLYHVQAYVNKEICFISRPDDGLS